MNPKGYVVIQEGDEQIHDLMERWLREAGYRVGAAEAEPDTEPVLVIADVPEPQSAEALIGALGQVYAAPILATSARFRRGLAGSAEAASRLGVKKVLPKPFTRKELLAAVREALAA